MEPPKLKLSWKSIVFPLLGIVGFFIYIYLFRVNILGILSTVYKVNPLIYGAAVGVGLAEVLFFSVSWRVLTSYLSIKLSVTRAYLYVWYGIYVDTIVPAQSISGEVTRTYLCTRDKCGPFGKVVASLYTHRLLGMLINIVSLVLGVVLLTFGGNVNPLIFNAIIVVTAAIVAIMVLMMVLSFKRQWTTKIVGWATKFAGKVTRGRWKLSSVETQALEITEHFHDSMKEFGHSPKALAGSMVYLVIAWVCNLSIPYLVFRSLDHPVSWSVILVTSAIFLAVKSIPLGVPEVGLPEAVMTTLYISMGVPGALAATATILTRIITLWLRFFIGFGAQQWLELKPLGSGAAEMEKPKIAPVA